MDTPDSREMYFWNPLKITQVSVFSKQCKILKDCLFYAKVYMYVYVFGVEEVIERNKWSLFSAKVNTCIYGFGIVGSDKK